MRTIKWFWLKPFVWFWNPFPRRIKVPSKKGGYVLDIRTRRWSEKVRKAEVLRRTRAGEDVKKTFKVYPAGSIELEGRSQ